MVHPGGAVFRSEIAVLLALGAAACTGTIGGRLAVDRDGGPAGTSDAIAMPGDDARAAEADAGAELADAGANNPIPDAEPAPDAMPPDTGGCETESLASRLSLDPVASITRRSMAAALAGGGLAVASEGNASIAIQAYDDVAQPSGSPIIVSGDGLWGFAASSDRFAVLVSRGDVLALVVVTQTGSPIAEQTLMGNVAHDVVNNEWFGSQLRAGRVDWTGTEWVTYSTVQRLWPDNIAHYGDTLRTFTADGAPANVYWGWGCSHSMEVRLTHNANGIGPVCSSDCYPQKGVFFMHQTTLYLDSSGNCAGYVAQQLGGAAPAPDGFFAGFVSGEGRTSKDAAIVHVGDDFRVGPILWLTDNAEDESDLHLTNYGDGYIAGWVSGSTGYLLRLDAGGSAIGAPEMISSAALGGAGDFFVLAGGDVAWINEGQLARLRVCR